MNAEGIAKFIDSCAHDNCSMNDNRVVEILEKYDKEKNGYLIEDNFLKFYSFACKNKSNIVTKNLETYHYRKDLKRYDEIQVE